MADVVTIREAVARAKADGLPVSEYMLRNWIRTGVLPVRYAGSRKLLYYPNLISFLRCEDGGDNLPAPSVGMAGKIRPVTLQEA